MAASGRAVSRRQAKRPHHHAARVLGLWCRRRPARSHAPHGAARVHRRRARGRTARDDASDARRLGPAFCHPGVTRDGGGTGGEVPADRHLHRAGHRRPRRDGPARPDTSRLSRADPVAQRSRLHRSDLPRRYDALHQLLQARLCEGRRRLRVSGRRGPRHSFEDRSPDGAGRHDRPDAQNLPPRARVHGRVLRCSLQHQRRFPDRRQHVCGNDDLREPGRGRIRVGARDSHGSGRERYVARVPERRDRPVHEQQRLDDAQPEPVDVRLGDRLGQL